MVVKSDLLSAQVHQEEAALQVQQAKNAVANARANLALLIGKPMGTPLNVDVAVQPPLPAGDAYALEQQALASNPGLRALREKVHMVGLFLLDKADIDRARLDFTFTGSYQSALKSLLQGQVDLAFVFNEVFEGASRITRESLRIIAQSDDAFAFHAFCVSPRMAQFAAPLGAVLAAMDHDPAGQRLLQDIGFSGFSPVEEEEVACLTALAEEYISGHEAIDLRATSSLQIDDSAFVVAREEPGDGTS